MRAFLKGLAAASLLSIPTILAAQTAVQTSPAAPVTSDAPSVPVTPVAPVTPAVTPAAPVLPVAASSSGKIKLDSTNFAPIFKASNATACKMAISYLDNDGRIRVADITCPSEKVFADTFALGDEMTFEPGKRVGGQLIFRVKKKEK
jgi:hypothetical protein